MLYIFKVIDHLDHPVTRRVLGRGSGMARRTPFDLKLAAALAILLGTALLLYAQYNRTLLLMGGGGRIPLKVLVLSLPCWAGFLAAYIIGAREVRQRPHDDFFRELQLGTMHRTEIARTWLIGCAGRAAIYPILAYHAIAVIAIFDSGLFTGASPFFTVPLALINLFLGCTLFLDFGLLAAFRSGGRTNYAAALLLQMPLRFLQVAGSLALTFGIGGMAWMWTSAEHAAREIATPDWPGWTGEQ